MEKVNKTLELENKPLECLKFVFEFLILPVLFGFVQLTFNIDKYLAFIVFLPDPRTLVQFTSVQSLSHVWLFATPWTAGRQASLCITSSQACSNSCPSIWWCHPTISSSVVSFSFCLQSFPASGSFPVSQFFASGGQRTLVDMTIFWNCVKCSLKN